MTADSGVRRRRGEPLVALVLLLGGWTGARMMLWESPFAHAASSITSASKSATRPPAVVELVRRPDTLPVVATGGSRSAPPTKVRARANVQPRALQHWAGLVGATTDTAIIAIHPPSGLLYPAKPAAAITTPALPQIAQSLPIIPTAGPARWHLATWAAWRQGSGLPVVANGPRPASYGGTQLGALLQFDVAKGPHRPALHVRASYAPDRPRQSEIAAGAGIRPVAGVPVRFMGEVRATRSGEHVEVRPAVLAVTEFAPAKLPLGLTGEGYAQGGWVGGRYATAFADGQARVTHDVTAVGPARLRLGAGAWGGAQKFASRLDVGPTVAVDLGRGAVSARLSVDYRVRVAGNASPGDGVALTLSTGF